MSRTDYMREYMQRYRIAGRDKRSGAWQGLPFRGIDGEGGNIPSGYHAYFLLSAGRESLFPHAEDVRITTARTLDFLSNLPANAINVIYFGDYDVTKWLEDVPFPKLERLMDRSSRGRKDGKGIFPVDWQDYEFDYLPKKEFKVRRRTETESGWTKWVYINDVGSFFQCRFVEALEKWGIGTDEERELIGAGKEARGTFEFSGIDEILKYNLLEIELLQQLMEKFRRACKETGIIPSKWQGPGQLAEALFRKYRVKKTSEVPFLQAESALPLLEAARSAFYGGRPEIAIVGPVERPVYQYDINSAYPTAMCSVPCLEHSRWERVSFDTPTDLSTVERGEFVGLVYGSYYPTHCNDDKKFPLWYGIPNRSESGSICYPASGRGWFWNHEVRSAIHQRFMVESAWIYRRICDCEPLGFVRGVYAQRQALGKDAEGIVLKLALNSLYGKTVQSIGNPQYSNSLWGSYITSWCRARIQDFIHGSPFCTDPKRWCGQDILMIATDSVATFTDRTDIEEGEDLGGWSKETHPRGMLLVQPGLYFGSSGRRAKTRGVPRSVIESYEDRFREAFRNMVISKRLEDGDISVPQTMFVGIRYALHRRNQKLLGQWIEFKDPETGREGKNIRFDWTTKRRLFPIIEPIPGLTTYIQTFPLQGDPEIETTPYDKDIGGLQLRTFLRQMFDDPQPDWISTISPGELRNA